MLVNKGMEKDRLLRDHDTLYDTPLKYLYILRCMHSMHQHRSEASPLETALFSYKKDAVYREASDFRTTSDKEGYDSIQTVFLQNYCLPLPRLWKLKLYDGP